MSTAFRVTDSRFNEVLSWTFARWCLVMKNVCGS